VRHIVHPPASAPSGGEALPSSVRSDMEPHFGADFRGVRVHADRAAAASARSLGARAYALGNHLVFGAGEYAPDTGSGRRLIAHELAHVVQQTGRIQRQPVPATAVPPADFSAVLRRVIADKVWLVGDPSRARESLIDKLDKGEAVTLVDQGLSEDFNRGAPLERKWWKVKVFVGAHEDQEGWVMERFLGRNYEVKKAGTRVSGALGASEVQVDTGQIIAPRPAGGFEGVGFGGSNVFSLTYEGQDAERMRWLQFAWREIIGVDARGNSTARKGTVTTDTGSYELTEGGTSTALGTPTKKENFNPDSRSDLDPFVDAAEGGPPGTAYRTAASTRFFDQPGPMVDLVKEMFDAGATTVVSRAHYMQFLVEDGTTVRYHAMVSVEWRFDDPKQADKPPEGVQKASAGGRASALPLLMAERLHQQYPAFRNLK